jgi:PAS domain S-box-containing protein
VFAEQVRLLYANLFISLLVGGAVGFLFLFSLQTWHAFEKVWTWFAVLALFTGLRGVDLYFYRRATAPDALRAYRRFLLGIVLAGLWWGATGPLFYQPGNGTNQMLIALVLAGISAGAVGTLAVRYEIVGLFLGMALLPYAVVLIMNRELVGSRLVFMLVLLFFLGMLMIAGNMFRALREMLQLRQQRDAYAEALRALHAITADDATVMPGKVDRMLDLGLEVLGMQRALVGRVAGEALVVEHARGEGAQQVLTRIVPLAETPCQDTFRAGEPRGVLATPGSSQADYDSRFRTAVYLGCVLSVGGRSWGTVSFTSQQPRTGFTDTERSLMHLFAQWIGAELAREQTLGALVAEKNRFEALFNALPDPVVVTDGELRITTVNPAFERVFGYAGPEVVGRTPRFLFGDPTQFETAELLIRDSLRTGTRRVVDASLRDQAGRPVEVELNARALRDGQDGTTSLLIHAHDVTERKRVSRMKDQFISTVSHELRTPLTAINGAIKLIHATQRNELNETAIGLLEIADRNGERLLRLVNDILDLERAAAGRLKLELRELRVADVVDGALRAIQPFAQELQVRLEMQGDPSPWVRGDAQRLEQVLLNLLSNAVKFSPAGAAVTVEISTTPERVRMAVADTGPGIPVEFQPRLFEHFSQSPDGQARRQGGSGLGLSIAKALAEQMGGSIGFETTPGIGTRFHVELTRVPPRGLAIDPAITRDGRVH